MRVARPVRRGLPVHYKCLERNALQQPEYVDQVGDTAPTRLVRCTVPAVLAPGPRAARLMASAPTVGVAIL